MGRSMRPLKVRPGRPLRRSAPLARRPAWPVVAAARHTGVAVRLTAQSGLLANGEGGRRGIPRHPDPRPSAFAQA